jgi:hypothetical protein
MKINKTIFLVLIIAPLVLVVDNIQGQPLRLTKEQAIEDFRC